jgi:hypothetical protein
MLRSAAAFVSVPQTRGYCSLLGIPRGWCGDFGWANGHQLAVQYDIIGPCIRDLKSTLEPWMISCPGTKDLMPPGFGSELGLPAVTDPQVFELGLMLIFFLPFSWDSMLIAHLHLHLHLHLHMSPSPSSSSLLIIVPSSL